MNRTFIKIVFACVLSIFAAGAVFAKSPIPSLNLSNSGLALRGYDPVAYFNSNKPIRGKSSISTKNAGATYYFSSEANKKQFLKNPRKYLPAYGGYCAYGTAVGAKVDGDPNIWHIVNGRLYLNITRPIDRTWKRNRAGYIKKANSIWPKLRNR